MSLTLYGDVRPIKPRQESQRCAGGMDPLTHTWLIVHLEHVDHVCVLVSGVRVDSRILVQTKVDNVVDLDALVVGGRGQQKSIRAG